MKELNQEVLLDLYSRMTTIREFEKEAIELAKMNLTRAAIHTYNGEEAIGVGVCAHLTNNDYIVSNHRGHGHCIAKGADLRRMFAELMARETGYCKGKGGSMHIADMDVGMLGANGIVGGGIPIAIGAALAQKYLNKDSITVVFFGDGASNEGTFHESINMAAVNHLPVIFLCENNQYAISLNVKESTGCENIADRAVGYGIPGYILDGNNVVEVYNKMGEIVDHVRQYGAPFWWRPRPTAWPVTISATTRTTAPERRWPAGRRSAPFWRRRRCCVSSTAWRRRSWTPSGSGRSR